MNAFWEMIVSNAIVATILAVGAALLGRTWRNAAAVHLLWLVVLLRLFTPPLVTGAIPFAFALRPPEAATDPRGSTRGSPARVEAGRAIPVTDPDSRGDRAVGDERSTVRGGPTDITGHVPRSLSTILAAAWICGASCVALVHAVRIRRFAGVIRDCEPAPAAIRVSVARLSSRLGLGRVPEVLMTSRALPPLVWSIGRPPRVILPLELFTRLSGEAQGTILAHELCHVRRGDHLVRFLELAATTAFWWHPVAWWACRQLHELEEQCCDSRVLELAPVLPRTYAATLVETLEFLSERPRTPIPLRTAISSTSSLTRRIRMMTQRRSNRLSASSASLVAGLVAFPLVVGFAGEQDPPRRTAPGAQQPVGAPAAILRGRVTDEAGDPLPDVRVRVAIPAADMRFVDASTDHMQMEVRSDARGDYRMEVPGIEGRTTISIDAMKPGFRRLVGTLRSGADPRSVEVGPGTEAEASLVLEPATYFDGIVVDEHGKPIPGVKIGANVSVGRGSGGIERTATDSDGSFELFNYSEEETAIQSGVTGTYIFFFHPDYIERRIEDIYALDPDRREAIRIVLETGREVAGTVLDADGKPTPDVMIKAIHEGTGHRKATMTDAGGGFDLRGLDEGPTMFSVLAAGIEQKYRRTIAVDGDRAGLEVRLQPMSLPADLKTRDVLGMKLADVTPDLKSAYDLYFEDGALILDPGEDSDRLNIGRLAEGYSFWMVGQKRVGSVREFVNQVLEEAGDRDAAEYSVRVVYAYSDLDGDGTNTQYLKLTKDDLKQLQMVLDQLEAAPR